MTIRVTRDRLILYLSIILVFLIHWILNDLSLNPGKFYISLFNNVWQVTYVVGMNFLYFEHVLPAVVSVKKNRFAWIVSSLVIYLMVFMVGLYAWWLLGIFLNIYAPFKTFSNTDQALKAIVGVTPGAFIVFAVFKLFFDYTQLKYEGQQVRLEKKQAELLFLKSQINPHFLFNTLNNIYSLSQYQPQLVSESILRLSKILRYLLYETSNEFTTTDKEIKILTDYMDLERLRYNDTVAIDFNHKVENISEMIPPLLLIPLVENAFKHGVSISKGNRFVDVNFIIDGRKLSFVVKNSIPMISKSKNSSSDNKDEKDNIGLANLKRRLELLYDDFELVTDKRNSVFTAKLMINLASHVKA